MLSLPIYLYPNVCKVTLDLDTTVMGVNQNMYQQDIKIQKGVKNTVQFQFKNSDQKLLSMSNSGTFVFSMFDAINQRLLLEKPITILDDSVTFNIITNQTAVSNTLHINTAQTLKVGQIINGFGIKPNSVIVAVTTNTITLNNYTSLPMTSSTVLTACTPNLRGLGELDFLQADTVDLAATAYKFSVKYLDQDGEFLPAYSDTYYGINGLINLADDIYPLFKPSQTVISFLSTLDTTTGLYYYPSGNIYAYPEFSGNSALHTLVMYMTKFKGVVKILGTLNNNPDNDAWYSLIDTLTYTGETDIDYVTFTGVYTYIKIIYTPSTRPGDTTNDDPTYFGSFDKVLYRS